MPKLDIYEFGRQLIEAKDLDPVYVVLNEAVLPVPELTHWLLAYLCFYHVGTASWAVEQGDAKYWSRMGTAAASKEYPRCHERRHFRGAAAIKSVAWLRSSGVGNLFTPLLGRREIGVAEVMRYVQTWVGFGPWVAFKVADILERLGLASVKFDLATVMYESPTDGAKLLWDREQGTTPDKWVGEWAVNKLLDRLGPMKAPPRYERNISLSEAETILCKWKSYMGGHYKIGEDLAATRSGLLRFARCEMSQRLLAAGKRGGLWLT